VTLHEMLTKHDPTSTPYQLPPVRRLNPHVSPALEKVIAGALEHDPNKRWQSTAEIKMSITGQLVSLPRRGGLGMPPAAPPRVPAPPVKTSRPTTKLLMAVASWSNRQIVLAGGGLLALVMLVLWFGTPVLSKVPLIWNTIPSFAIVAPMVYTAVRRHWVASVAHALVVVLGEVVIGLRLPYLDLSKALPLAFLAAVLTGLLIEGFVWLLPRVRGKNREEAWQRELAWLMTMTVVVAVIVMGIVWGWPSAASVGMWISAAILGAVGWFLGDLVQQYFFMRQTGLKRGLGGS